MFLCQKTKSNSFRLSAILEIFFNAKIPGRYIGPIRSAGSLEAYDDILDFCNGSYSLNIGLVLGGIPAISEARAREELRELLAHLLQSNATNLVDTVTVAHSEEFRAHQFAQLFLNLFRVYSSLKE
jgi:hypothetical protein